MNNAANVIVNILVNSSGAQAGVNTFNTTIGQIVVQAQNAAGGAANAFTSIFGANFFANLASNMVQAMAGGFRSFVSDAVNAASKVESALTGLGSTSKNLGFSKTEVVETVRNLDLVRNGLLTVGEASTAAKNLLSTGFSLPQTIELIKRFGDTAAFGRQSALTFGYAISSATEGIKNQNSILVDNAGVTKNLSVILKERGFQIQDLSDKVKGASAREALYQGLLKETAVQQGDANKLLDTTQGKLSQIDSAYQRFLAALGETATKSEIVKGALAGVVSVLDFMGRNTGTVILLATSFTVLTAAVALTTTSFTSLTIAQITSAAAGSGLAKVLTAIPLILTNIQYVTALTAGEIAILSGGFLAIIGILAGVAYALYSMSSSQSEATKQTKESIVALQQQKTQYQTQIAALNSLGEATTNEATRQTILTNAYQGVNIATQERIVRLQASVDASGNAANATETEREKIRVLTEEYKRLNTEQDKRLETASRLAASNFIEKINLLETQNRNQQQAALDSERLQNAINQQNQEAANRGISELGASGETIYFQREADAYFASLGEEMQKTTKDAKELYDQLELTAKIRNTDVESIIRQKYAFDGNSQAADGAVAAYRRFIQSQNIGTIATNQQTDAITAQINELRKLQLQSDETAVVSARRELITKVQTRIAEQSGGNVATAKQEFEKAKTNVKADDGTSFGTILKEQQNFEKVNRELDKVVSPRPERQARAQKTQFETLSDSVRKLRAEVQSYTNLTSREFKLRFEKEELERVKRDFERIIDLRRELGKPLDTPLPTTAGGARAEIERLERIKNLRDDVLKVNREIADAEGKLIVARITATAAVVDAQTRADTIYLDGLRKRRDAEAQLTAELADEFRTRADLALNAGRRIENAQAEAFRDFLRDETRRDDEKLKQIARIQLLSGSSFETNEQIREAARIANSPRPDVSPVVSRLDTSNKLLEEIRDAVKKSETNSTSNTGTNSTSNTGGATTNNVIVDLNATPTGGGRGIVRDANAVDKRKESDLRSFVNSQGFRVVRTFGSAINKGSLHPLGQAADVSIRDKTIEEQENFLAAALAQGYRVVDERKKLAGIKQTGPHIHLEINPRRESKFQPNESFYSAFGINRLRNLDDARFKGSTNNTVNTSQISPTNSDGDIIIVPLNSQQRTQTQAQTTQTTQTTQTKPTDDKNVVNVQIPPNTRERVNPLAGVLERAFGIKGYGTSDLEGLSDKSNAAILKYVEAQREFNENTKEQVIGVDRLNQALNVNFTQVRELEVAQDQYNRLLSGDSVAVQEVLQDAEIQRAKAAKESLGLLISTNAYLDKLRSGDPNIIGQLITADDADRAQDTARAYEDIAKATNFLNKFASGDAAVLENLQKNREAARELERKSLTVEVDNLKAQAAAGGRDKEIEKLNIQKEYYSTIVAVGKTEAEIEKFRALRADPTFVAATRQNDVLSEQLEIERKLASLEDERATAPINQSLRERLAVEQELTRIYRDQFDAQTDAAVARVRIADLSVYHEGRANARVLEHIASMKSLTEIYSDAKIAVIDKVWGGLDTLFGKLTNKIPVFGSILKDILSNLTKLILNPFIMQLLGLGGASGTAGGQTGGTGGGNRGTGNILSGLGGIFTGNQGGGIFNFGGGNFNTSGGTSGATFGGIPINALQFLAQSQTLQGGNRSNLSNGGNISFPFLGTIPLGDLQNAVGGAGATRPRVVGQAANQVGGSFLSQIFGGKFDFKGLGKSLGSLAPLLGLTLGASVGGSSIGGQILGAGGGLLAGGVLSALTAGSLTGATTGGIFGSIGGFLGISAGATAGIALAAAPLLILGAYFLGRNKLRRQEEKQRTQILVDAKKQLTDILNQTRAGQLDSVSALSQADAIRQQYLQQVGQLKDRKTRNIAIATVRELDAIIDQIKIAGRASDFAKAQDDAFVPTFAGGGIYSYAAAAARSMNINSFNDSKLAIFNPNTEAVLTRQNVYNLGGYNALRKAGVRGADYFTPPVVRQEAAYQDRTNANRGGSSGDTPIHAFIVFDDETKNKMIANSSGRAIIKVIKPLIAAGMDDGLTDAISDVLAGE